MNDNRDVNNIGEIRNNEIRSGEIRSGEIRYEKIRKDYKTFQQQKRDECSGKKSWMRKISDGNELKSEQKKCIMKLNILQTVLLVIVLLTEVLSIYGYISEVFSIIGLMILCAGCVIIMKKIKKTLQL